MCPYFFAFFCYYCAMCNPRFTAALKLFFNVAKKCKKKYFYKVLKINVCLKKFKMLSKNVLYLFADIKKSLTFALAFGKQRGNAVL